MGKRIGDVIVAWVKGLVRVGPTFHACFRVLHCDNHFIFAGVNNGEMIFATCDVIVAGLVMS